MLTRALEPGPLGGEQPACEGALGDDVHVHAINLKCLVNKAEDRPSCPAPWGRLSRRSRPGPRSFGIDRFNLKKGPQM